MNIKRSRNVIAYQLVMLLPRRWNWSRRLSNWLLPYAGIHAFEEQI